jgi:hypothetical protein
MSASISTDSGAAKAATARLENSWGVGATYVTSAGDTALTIGTGFSGGDVANTATQTTGGKEGFHAGVSAVTGDLTVAVGYGDGNSFDARGGENTAANMDIEGSVLKAGISYVTGDITLAVGVTSGEGKDSNFGATTTADDSKDSMSGSVTYAVASGVSAVLGYLTEDHQDDGASATTGAALVASAAAFAPSTLPKATTALNAFESELGVQDPLGFFDPLGLLTDADQEKFERLRYTEIKHGRISMLAFLGNIITRAGLHLPGAIDKSGDTFDSIPNGWAAIKAMPEGGVLQIIVFVGFLELGVMKDVTGENEFVGDFRNGWIDFGWDTFSEEEKLFKRGVELNNGRAAMLGILGLMVHEQLGGSLPIVGEM